MATVTRRKVLTWTGGAIWCVRLGPSLAATPAEIAPQPYFAGVTRTLEAQAKLGAPVAAADAKELTTLAHQSDSAAVGAAEKILDRYTLARIEIQADGYALAAPG